MKTIKVVRMVIGLGLLAAGPLEADVAYNYPSTLVGNGGTGPYTIGNLFTVNSSIEVNQLGIFDGSGSAIPGSGISVAIYAVSMDSEQLVGSTLAVAPVTFTSLNPGTLLAGTSTRLLSVPGTILGPGTYMVVANNYGSAGALPYYDTTKTTPGLISGNTGGGALTFGAAFREDGIVPLTPSLADPSDWGYFDTQKPRMAAGNFDFTVVPEAGAFAGIVVGLLALVYAGRWVVSRCSGSLA